MKSAKFYAVAAAVLLVLAVMYNLYLKTMPSTKKINLTAADEQKISATYYYAPSAKGWLLMTHMMPATKESWDSFAKEMQKNGYSGIAIDLRGHGESEGGPDGYKNFTDAEHQAGIEDLEAAWRFLESEGAKADKSVVIGSSIGANLSLQFLAIHPDIRKAVLLSAGLDYRGVRTKDIAATLLPAQSILLVTSKDDGTDAAENSALYKALPGNMNKQMIVFEKGGHGNNMFSDTAELDLTAAIYKFIENGSVN